MPRPDHQEPEPTLHDLTRFAGRPIGFMLSYVARHPVAHALIVLSVLVGVACSVSASFASKLLVNALQAASIDHHKIGQVWLAVIILLALIAVDNLSWRIGGWISTRTFVDVTGDIRRDLFRHLTGHSAAYFADRMPGTLAGRITATANATFLVENLGTWNVLPPTLAVIISIIYMATVRWWIALGLVVLSVALSILLFRLAAAGRVLHHAYAADAARVDGELLDVINNMPLVRAFGAAPRERLRFSRRLRGEMKTRTRSLRYLEKLRLLHAVLTAALTAALLVVSVLLWIAHGATTGDIVMIVSLGFTILHGTRDLAVALVETIQHIARLAEALGTLLLPHDMPDAPEATGFPQPARGAVEFRHVAYAYPGGDKVLDDFNLSVEPGQRIGLVGRSGSGKTTVLALLQRLRYIQGGELLLDGTDIRRLTDAALRTAISVVPQDVSLFHRSVLENIRYGKPEANDDEVVASADAAGCRDFIEAMPEGFHTEVGDRGIKLSGGQRQRIAIARAFLRNAPILLLDEATSALDSESEHRVQEALDRLMVGRTVIAVAHRLSTLRNFDRIVVMQQGRILQDGPPSVLERESGPYRELLSLQAMTLEDVA
jgi:ATP-binding cassette subfamily B protein